jgi:hypothetical protein
MECGIGLLTFTGSRVFEFGQQNVRNVSASVHPWNFSFKICFGTADSRLAKQLEPVTVYPSTQ